MTLLKLKQKLQTQTELLELKEFRLGSILISDPINTLNVLIHRWYFFSE